MAPPFRADHVGSLIRPGNLLAARKAVDSFANKTDSHADHTNDSETSTPDEANANLNLATVQAEAISTAVSEQVTRHIVPITTGEYERWIFYAGFFEVLEGISKPHMDFDTQARPGLPQARQAKTWGISGRPTEYAHAKVKHSKPAYLADWLALKSLLEEHKVPVSLGKMTLPSPVWFHIQRAAGTAYAPSAYDSDTAFLNDMAAAVRAELMVLYNNGLRCAQIDDPNLTFFCDEEFIAASKAAGTDLDALFDQYVACHNTVLRDLPADFHVGLHLCRGNYPGGLGLAKGGYGKIAKALFQECDYKLFYLEFDTERAGTFEPLALLPVDKAVVLGIVSSKQAALEDLDVLEKRVMDAADVIAEGQKRTRAEVLRDNLSVSPQCGFASVNFGKGKGFDDEIQWKKLELVRDLARKVWPEEAA